MLQLKNLGDGTHKTIRPEHQTRNSDAPGCETRTDYVSHLTLPPSWSMTNISNPVDNWIHSPAMGKFEVRARLVRSILCV